MGGRCSGVCVWAYGRWVRSVKNIGVAEEKKVRLEITGGVCTVGEVGSLASFGAGTDEDTGAKGRRALREWSGARAEGRMGKWHDLGARNRRWKRHRVKR